MFSRRTIGVLATAAVAVGAAVAGLAPGGEDLTRRHAVAERGAEVMPFSLDTTTHVFEPAATGGTQRVIADDRRDREQIRLIRLHLREEATAFQRGDFADPASIHGETMPGLEQLRAGHRRSEVRYRDLPDGARIDYETSDRSLAAAVRDWFDAQVNDHGAHAETGRR